MTEGEQFERVWDAATRRWVARPSPPPTPDDPARPAGHEAPGTAEDQPTTTLPSILDPAPGPRRAPGTPPPRPTHAPSAHMTRPGNAPNTGNAPGGAAPGGPGPTVPPPGPTVQGPRALPSGAPAPRPGDARADGPGVPGAKAQPFPHPPAPAPGDPRAPGWFARSQEPPPMPRGATFADAAGAPPPPQGDLPGHGASGPYGSGPGSATVAGMPTAPGAAWTSIPPAPPPNGPGRVAPAYDPPAGDGPGGDGRVRTLGVIAVVVLLIAAAVAVVVWQPWSGDDKSPVSNASGGPTRDGGATGTGAVPPPPAPRPTGGTPTTGATSASPSPSASPSGDPAEQARALSDMLDHSGSSRQSVINAVADAQACTRLDAAFADLNTASQARNELLAELTALRFDALPEVEPALEQLRTAWRESASADDHYAAWAQAQSTGGCGAGGAEKSAGDAASGRATTAKQAFVRAWNDIALRYGLPTRTELAI
ncbi:hypothetical protein LO772_10665 [Yinghuangia sp. ASG 101]|uniref:hypothetical protein n=1 Tax=Yinghuangia sp. ASG 101 TaxID=2896848 RepID=UPI001E2BBD58|nr:hypothetical protein [Yinghuangia sp. ASG 101]UGQ14014.1 hypothetical protein LO772_10665 [Yinghuangia sp. ASG 101]